MENFPKIVFLGGKIQNSKQIWSKNAFYNLDKTFRWISKKSMTFVTIRHEKMRVESDLVRKRVRKTLNHIIIVRYK